MYDHLHYGSSCEFLQHITEYELLSWGSVSASIRMERGRDLGQSALGSFQFFLGLRNNYQVAGVRSKDTPGDLCRRVGRLTMQMSYRFYDAN